MDCFETNPKIQTICIFGQLVRNFNIIPENMSISGAFLKGCYISTHHCQHYLLDMLTSKNNDLFIFMRFRTIFSGYWLILPYPIFSDIFIAFLTFHIAFQQKLRNFFSVATWTKKFYHLDEKKKIILSQIRGAAALTLLTSQYEKDNVKLSKRIS